MNLKEKGLICFEEISDYSFVTDEKVYLDQHLKYKPLVFIANMFCCCFEQLKNRLKRKGVGDNDGQTQAKKVKGAKNPKNKSKKLTPKKAPAKVKTHDEESKKALKVKKTAAEPATVTEGQEVKPNVNPNAKSKAKKRKDLREKRKRKNARRFQTADAVVASAPIVKKKSKSQKSNSTSKVTLHVKNEEESASFDAEDFETSRVYLRENILVFLRLQIKLMNNFLFNCRQK